MPVSRRFTLFVFFGTLASCCLVVSSVLAAIDPAARFDKHWSFQPITLPAIPVTRDDTWAKNPIDAFILSRLEQANLKPSRECDRRTLIRRVYFDLIGLPPAPDEVDAFVQDSSTDAYEKVVDRLLASPRYGERWARHWLDAVRFAESYGFEMNKPRPNAWPYRDYVIDAFNEDKPYDQFVREQLAGDAMGIDAATGYLVGGPSDQVKSPDPNLTAQQRMDELHDMVATTGSTFLGLTVGCARCHDHKFDPISQVDYYRMQAIFAGVMHGDRRVRTKDFTQRMHELTAERHAVDTELARFEKITASDAAGSHPLRAPVNAKRNVEDIVPANARFVRFTITATNNLEPCIDELEIYGPDDPQRNIALASLGAKATASSVFPGNTKHQIDHLNDGRYGNSNSWISHELGKGWVQIELPGVARVNRIVWSRDREGRYTDRVPTGYTIEVAEVPDVWHTVATSANRNPYGTHVDPKTAYRTHSLQETAALAIVLAKSQSVDDEIENLSNSLIYAGKFEQPGPTYRLYRGEATQPREPVTPGAVQAISPKLDLSADAPEQQRRMALAQWIVDAQNPLTARVIVNRLWQHHFGRGIVDTPSDFGHMGARPTHPKLLDWLATQLVAGSWKLKPIQRLIVLSATYRQASDSNSQAATQDAACCLLWRFPPQRLEAEQIHDAILSITGKLDLTMGGPGFDAFKPNDNYVRIYTPKEEFGPADWRRMVYEFKPRLQQDGTFGIFDCPDGGQIAPKRATSTTPLQALNLLNSPFMIQQAQFLANRVRQQAGDDSEAQTIDAFRLAFGRSPTQGELHVSLAMVRKQGLPLLCRALLNANEFVYIF